MRENACDNVVCECEDAHPLGPVKSSTCLVRGLKNKHQNLYRDYLFEEAGAQLLEVEDWMQTNRFLESQG